MLTNKKKDWLNVSELFRRTRKTAPWQTVRMETNGGKGRRTFRIRRLNGYLKGISSEVALVSSEKSCGDGRICLVCSNGSLDSGVICRVYRRRWMVEIFHKNIKSFLGFENVGTHKFQSVESHVYWVYTAYLKLHEMFPDSGEGVRSKQIKFKNLVEKKKIKYIYQVATRFDGSSQVKRHCSQALQTLNVA